MHMIKVTGAIVALGVAFAGCGGGSTGSGAPSVMNPPAPVVSPTAPPASPTTGPTATVAPTSSPVTKTGFSGDAKIAQVNGQTILVDASSGLALYFFNADTTNTSNCTGGCLAIWPSHAASAGEKADGNFSIFARSDGNGMQWAYKGRPLYTFVSDSPTNNATGNNFQNFVLATP